MAYTLPFLADDPWRLHDELRDIVGRWPRRTAPEQFAALMEQLRVCRGGSVWVERTGGSLPHARAIVEAFPSARFVVLTRDPVETALSMRTGSFFRLCLAVRDGHPEQWLDHRYADPVRLAEMLEAWTSDSLDAIAALPADRVCNITFERLTESPEDVLVGAAEFVLDRSATAHDRRWARDSSTFVAGAPARAEALPAASVRRVRCACPRASAAWTALRAAGR